MPDNQDEIKFSEASLEKVNVIIGKYPEGRQKSALLPVLHLAQAEFGGWLSTEVMNYVASLLHIQPIEAYEVATFYTMFNLKPVGKYVVEVCQTGPCALNGAGELLVYLEKKLNIRTGETTADGKLTLRTTECLANCGNGPVIQVGENFYENMNIDKVDELIEKLLN